MVECSALSRAEIVGESLELQERGCDIIGQTEDKLQMVASAEDLTTLLQLGYRPQIVRDLAREDAWHE